MPPTIQDAITVCRGLKIPYLWVDPLCIVQDDPQAWAEDAAEMDCIYLHSRLTIAALEPATCKSHFLGRQRFGSEDWQISFTADLSDRDSPGSSPVFGEKMDIFVRTNLETEDAGEKCSLDTRGWCLQESLLPNRRLCFNGDEMIWECLCRKTCECGHVLRRPEAMQYAQMGAYLKSKRLKAEVRHSQPQPKSHESRVELRLYGSARHSAYSTMAQARWRSLVEEFTRRSVSRPVDRLNAVSGLAKLARDHLMRNRLDEEVAENAYLAGLWRNEFHFDLAWTVTEFSERSQSEALEVEGRTASSPPTWSWASVDGAVAYFFQEVIGRWKYRPVLRDCVEVKHVSCHTVLPDDETSAVTSGRALLSAALTTLTLTVVRSLEGELKPHVVFHNKMAEVNIDHPRYVKGLQASIDEDGDAERSSHLGPSIDRHPRPERSPARENVYYGLRLFSWIAYASRGLMGPETWFLLLRPSSSVEGAFERIGIGNWDTGTCPFFESSQITDIEIV